jgi:hypothetical protein
VDTLKAVISTRFSRSYKRRPDQARRTISQSQRAIWKSDVRFVLEKAVAQKSASVRSVQLWSVNQRTKEAEEVTDSWIRTKSVTVKVKTLEVQEEMERALVSHRL